MARQLPAGVVSLKQWCYGELEFDALMRQLDNAVSPTASRHNFIYSSFVVVLFCSV